MPAPLPFGTYPVCAYADPVAAVSWLSDALGFSLVHEQRGPLGDLERALLHGGDAVVVVEPARGADGPKTATLVVVDDVLATHEHVLGLGAAVGPVRVTTSGCAEFLCTDPGGVSWVVSNDDPWRYV